MSSISGINSSITALYSVQASQSTGRTAQPADPFTSNDTDSSGGLDTVELSSLALELSRMTGSSIDAEAMMTTYDGDEDSILSQEEMSTMISDILGPPPEGGPPVAGSDSDSAPIDRLANLDSDQLARLFAMLEEDATGIADSNTAVAPPPPPDPAEKFAELDTDSSGGLSSDELEVMSQEISQMGGAAIDTESALNEYDTDGDGELSADEMAVMMEELHPAGRPEDGSAGSMRAMGPPPPPPPSESDLDSSLFTSQEEDTDTSGTTLLDSLSNNQLNMLRELLQRYEGNSTDSGSSVNITG